MTTPNGWSRYEELVLSELRRLNTELVDLNQKFDTQIPPMRAEMGALRVKAGIWGLAAGLLPAVAALLVLVLKGLL